VRYRRDTERFETAQAEERRARAEVKRTTPAASAAQERAADEASAKDERDSRTTFLLRLALVLVALVVSFPSRVCGARATCRSRLRGSARRRSSPS